MRRFGSDEIGRVALASRGRRRASSLLVAPQALRVEHDQLESGPITIPLGQIEQVEIADPALAARPDDCLDLSAGAANLLIRLRAPVFAGRLRFRSFRRAVLARPSRTLICETPDPARTRSIFTAAGIPVHGA